MKPNDTDTSFDFELSAPLEYHASGSVANSPRLTLTAPSAAQRNFTTVLKQGFFGALNYHKSNKAADMQAARPEGGDDEIGANELLALLYMSNIDLQKFEEAFRNLILAKGICMVGGGTPLTGILLDKISDKDMDRLMGTYLVNFTIGSWLKELSK